MNRRFFLRNLAFSAVLGVLPALATTKCLHCNGTGACSVCAGSGRFQGHKCGLCNGTGTCYCCRGTGHA
ncbi:MAG TPA: hypothetical protein VGO93_23125 [Candidatus Xenobia bacterium]|jgi:hypothetical protein